MTKDIELGSWVKRKSKRMVGLVIETIKSKSGEWMANVEWQNGKNGLYRISELGEVIRFLRTGGKNRRGKKQRWSVVVDYGNGETRERGSRLGMDYLYEQKEKYAPTRNSKTNKLIWG